MAGPLQFLDKFHKFNIDFPQPARQGLEFGNKFFFTTLVAGEPIAVIEQSMLGGAALFNNPVLGSALFFHAECIVFSPKAGAPQFPEIDLQNRFDFGFVQGIRDSDLHLDFWGRFAEHGRTVVHINMPNSFEVDTDPAAQPFTRVAGSRFKIKNVTETNSQFNFLKVSADFSDHPLYVFDHTLIHKNNRQPNFLRSIDFTRTFHTIFCFREKRTGDFTAISSSIWDIRYNQELSYLNKDPTNRKITDKVTGHVFASGGSPSTVGATDRQILAMAKAGSPFVNRTIAASRMAANAPGRTVTTEDKNGDFVQSFFP